MIYLLIGYMWLFIHRPFEVWPWLAELRIERVYMLMVLAYWALQPKVWTRNRINAGIAFLGLSIFLSALFSPYEGLASIAVQDWFKLALFYLLLITSVRSLADLKILVAAFVVILGLYELHSLREFYCGRGVYRMGTWRMIGVDTSMGDPNSFAASIVYGIPLLLPVSVLAQKQWQKVALGGLLLLAVGCILLTGSRSGFVALLLSGFGFAMVTKYRFKILLALCVAAPLVWGYISDDLRNRYLTLIDPSLGPASAQASAESREQFFFMAIDIWRANPLFGVGPRGFAYASDTGRQSHSLYAETLSELGTFGAIALVTLLAGFLHNFRAARAIFRESPPTTDARFCYFLVCATGIAVLQLLFLGLAGHNIFRYTWLWYAAFSVLALRFLEEHATSSEDALSAADSDFAADQFESEAIFGGASSRGATAIGVHHV